MQSPRDCIARRLSYIETSQQNCRNFMIELILMRHAKSSRDDAAIADHERPLSKRGRSAAKAMGLHLAAAGLVPDLVLCLSAHRS